MEKNKGEIMVSIIMMVYNHEEFLPQALESVLAQETNFRYELLIGEDHSQDNSLSIIRHYEKLKPDVFRVFAREKNIGALKNGYELRCNSRGRYLIHLEGDDYWTDNKKLQKQVDFLESHPEYIACAHRFHTVDRQGQIYYDRDFERQFFQDNPYTKEILEKGLMLSHVSTILCKNIFLDKSINTDFWITFPHTAMDYTFQALLILNGPCYCMPEYMGCYRKVVATDSSSFSSRQEQNNNRDALFRSTVEVERVLNQEYSIDYTARKKRIFASAVFKWYREKNKKNLQVVKNIIRSSGQPFLYARWFFYLVISRFYKNITGKKDELIKF